ncbi:hypothetical protein [Haloarchaeobius amylolyticus]|uniref:hypothetical protein n=1 Tax=Haloarchaeobius amylolyticus TaxID=1198296 RepID=UPI00226EEDDA|nr:hypothetical protein [Haloarchaeobius amylolyticus]
MEGLERTFSDGAALRADSPISQVYLKRWCHSLNKNLPDGDVGGSSRRIELPSGENGTTLGVCLYLTLDELRELGVEVDGADYLKLSVDGETQRIELSRCSEEVEANE